MFSPASRKQKIVTGAVVVLVSIAALGVWFVAFGAVQVSRDKEYSASWAPPRGILLAPGPPSFHFDASHNALVSRGPIDSKLKRELASLVSSGGVALFPPDPAGKSYWQALDQLAYSSNKSSRTFALLLLLLGGLSGLIGVQLRSLINFIGNACIKNTLDVDRWWPWYALRPPAGFIFGLAVVLFIQVGFFPSESGSSDAVTWAIVVAILAGFGASEFADRLRLLAKTLFGESPNSLER